MAADSVPFGERIFESVWSRLTHRRWGRTKDWTIIELFEHVLGRISYLLTAPTASALLWLTGAETRSFGFATAQLSGLVVTGMAAVRLVENRASEALAATLIGGAACAVAVLMIPACRRPNPSDPEAPIGTAHDRKRHLTNVRSLFSVVAVATLVSGYGPRAGVVATYLIAVGITIHFSKAPKTTCSSWIRVVLDEPPVSEED